MAPRGARCAVAAAPGAAGVRVGRLCRGDGTQARGIPAGGSWHHHHQTTVALESKGDWCGALIPTDSRFDRPQYPTSIHPRNWIGEPYLTGGNSTMTHRILIIDDEAEVRHNLVDLLSGFGHDAEAAGNPREAFTMLAERTYALILTDLHMTQMAGEGRPRADSPKALHAR